MKGAQQSLDTRSKSLVEIVERERQKRCAEVIEQARAEARRIVKQAWGKGRARLHLEVLASREQFRRQLLFELASHETRRRQLRQQADRRLLEQAWQLLGDTLVRRWQQPEARQIWVDAVIAQALKRLADGPWRVEYPSDWPQEEQSALVSRLRQALDPAPLLVVDPALQAGIRVRAGSSVVDGSCEGLLRDRARVEARFLADIRKPQNA